MASVFDFGSPAAGVGGSALASYLAARRLSLAEQAGDTRNALGQEQLLAARRARSMAEAQPKDLAAVMGLGKQTPLSSAGPMSIAPQARVPVTPGELEAQAAGLEMPSPGTMPVPRSLGAPTIAPASATTGELPGRTIGDLSTQLGPETTSRLMSTPAGQAVLKEHGGLVTADEAARRVTRAQAKKDSEAKFSEAQEAYLSDDPETQARGMLLEQAALRALVSAGVGPVDRLTARMDKLGDEFKASRKDTTENKAAGEEVKAILEAHMAYKPGDVESEGRLVETLAGAKTRRGRGRADEIIGQMAKVFGAKLTPEAKWVAAVAGAMETRLKAGTATSSEDDLTSIYQEAMRLDPEAGAYAQTRALASVKTLSPAMMKAFGIAPDVPENIYKAAHQMAAFRDKLPVGSKAYYDAREKYIAQYTKERQRPLGTSRDWTEPVLNRRRNDRRIELDAIQQQIEKLGQYGDPAARAERASLQERARGVRAALQAIDDDLADRGYLPRAAAEATRPKPPQALAPPAKLTTSAVAAEMKRLVGLGHTPESARDAMKLKGWTVK